ncbi:MULTISPECIES: hypothetical protein [unclassified Novosphingobium]|uniref:hypothetical protein n=1 Tax=unclassified Novosphingobium TaxID=2644732 RepID=UPI00130E8964|nr:MULTISPECIES: hypothetical protein [unclassified Novosphingobium]MBB3651480.1 hypothetical protein [Novosphingobium sp. BK626]MBB3357300.1 hypothetical protein [Novosphingobium sp. BK256]MBB3374038.1 hypothetical protein [Novosphingobium sp. BK280]MBB3378450.1 hypothetical protein [Novosphingobium sp. BK258]MBB3419766.1 hypothetical protein [Novosphingobium sp. BK267]
MIITIVRASNLFFSRKDQVFKPLRTAAIIVAAQRNITIQAGFAGRPIAISAEMSKV